VVEVNYLLQQVHKRIVIENSQCNTAGEGL